MPFCFDWAGENNWLVPPVSLVPRVIRSMGTLIVGLSSSLVPILPFPSALKRPLFLPMFLIFLFRALQSRFLMALNLSLMY